MLKQYDTIYLIRHAQSRANADASILKKNTNVGITLTDLGVHQAKEAAIALAKEAEANKDACVYKIWNSPYNRTRETATIIKQYLTEVGLDFAQEESIYLSERQFGLVDDAPDYVQTHSAEYSHFLMHKNNKQDFFARPPLGESPFDVCLRVDFFLKTILQHETWDASGKKRVVHVLVSHGAAIRSFIMMHLGLKYEQYAEMLNPANASISKMSKSSGLEYEWFRPSSNLTN